ncbi:MAG: DUF1501 domain-containing protein [Planctomycetota bacterium]
MLTRRDWLRSSRLGFGYLALAALAQQTVPRTALAAGRTPHFTPRAKRVIFLCMEGGPSHVDTFDYKPELTARSGQAVPGGRGGLFGAKLYGSPFTFAQHGESGLWISELFPSLARHADQLCLLRGMHTDLPNHPQAFLQMHCGIYQFPRPSLGSWVLYGLGSENDNLPGFITINPPQTNGGSANYSASFLPAVYQGTRIGGPLAGGEQVSNLKNSRRSLDAQRLQLDFAAELSRAAPDQLGESSAVESLISSYELAFRMQKEMPGTLDLKQETAATLRLYGIEGGSAGASENGGMAAPGGGGLGGGGLGGGRAASASSVFGRQCLLARRLIEAGVRFVEVTAGGWDHHRSLKDSLTASCRAIDQPIAGLLTDLEQRGLLSDTLVVWGGEFGRTPHAQGGDGRDHNSKGFTMWMAGGGVKGGLSYGQTDDLGYQAVHEKMHIHDWHATLLHLLGLDHEQLTYRYAGRAMRLTDVHGEVVQSIVR